MIASSTSAKMILGSTWKFDFSNSFLIVASNSALFVLRSKDIVNGYLDSFVTAYNSSSAFTFMRAFNIGCVVVLLIMVSFIGITIAFFSSTITTLLISLVTTGVSASFFRILSASISAIDCSTEDFYKIDVFNCFSFTIAAFTIAFSRGTSLKTLSILCKI